MKSFITFTLSLVATIFITACSSNMTSSSESPQSAICGNSNIVPTERACSEAFETEVSKSFIICRERVNSLGLGIGSGENPIRAIYDDDGKGGFFRDGIVFVPWDSVGCRAETGPWQTTVIREDVCGTLGPVFEFSASLKIGDFQRIFQWTGFEFSQSPDLNFENELVLTGGGCRCCDPSAVSCYQGGQLSCLPPGRSCSPSGIPEL